MQDIGITPLLGIPFVHTLVFYSVALLALVVGLVVFGMITRYNDWEEIKKGNLAVAMGTGGKIFGICNIFRYAISNEDTLLQTLSWAGFGFVLLLIAYFLFDLLTPMFRIDQEIRTDNRAVGFVAMAISISISYVIGACVT
jgi:putative membrane protein